MPDERFKVAYPGIVVAWKSVSTQLASEEGQRLAEDWQAVGDLIAWADGHGFCGGWTFDPHTQRITCACGADLFEVGEPETAETAGAA